MNLVNLSRGTDVLPSRCTLQLITIENNLTIGPSQWNQYFTRVWQSRRWRCHFVWPKNQARRGNVTPGFPLDFFSPSGLQVVTPNSAAAMYGRCVPLAQTPVLRWRTFMSFQAVRIPILAALIRIRYYLSQAGKKLQHQIMPCYVCSKLQYNQSHKMKYTRSR